MIIDWKENKKYGVIITTHTFRGSILFSMDANLNDVRGGDCACSGRQFIIELWTKNFLFQIFGYL